MPVAQQTSRQERHETHIDAAVELGNAIYKGTVLSLSEDGLFVAIDEPIMPGVASTVSFMVNGLGRVRLSGHVAYLSTHRHRRGIGVRFSSPIRGKEILRVLSASRSLW